MSIFDDPVMLHREIQRIGGTGTGRQFFSKDKLAEPPAPDPYVMAPEEEDTGTRLSHAELDKAEDELAAQYGRVRVNDLIHLTHGQATLGRSENERWAVLGQVVLALRNHEREVPPHKVARLEATVLELAAQQGTGIAGGGGLEDEAVRLAADHADVLGLTVSAEQRRALAKKGHALGPDGDFPIPDAHHLGLAKAAYKKGDHAGHTKDAVKAHINKNARRLGLPGLDDDEDDETLGATVALSAGPQERARQAARLGDSADAIAARHPGFFG